MGQVELDAAGHRSGSSFTVGHGESVEVESLLVQGQGPFYVVGNAGEVQIEPAFFQAEALAGELQRAGFAFQFDVAGEETGELVEDGVEEVLGVAQFKAIQLQVYLCFLRGGREEGRAPDGAAPVQRVVHAGTEALAVLVPDTAQGQLSQPASGNGGGVAEDAGQKARGRGGR